MVTRLSLQDPAASTVYPSGSLFPDTDNSSDSDVSETGPEHDCDDERASQRSQVHCQGVQPGTPSRDVLAAEALCDLSVTVPATPPSTLSDAISPQQRGALHSKSPVTMVALHQLLAELQGDALACTSGAFEGWCARATKIAARADDVSVFHYERLVDALSDFATTAVERSVRITWQASVPFATIRLFGACQMPVPLPPSFQAELRNALQTSLHFRQHADDIQVVFGSQSLPYFLQIPLAALLFLLPTLLRIFASSSPCCGIDPANAGQASLPARTRHFNGQKGLNVVKCAAGL